MIRRFLLAAVCLTSSWAATPQLTTIQDVLYKADGTRFNGILTISWNSFQSADSADIVTQSLTVKVLAGILRVQLVPSPTSPAGYYTVVYLSLIHIWIARRPRPKSSTNRWMMRRPRAWAR